MLLHGGKMVNHSSLCQGITRKRQALGRTGQFAREIKTEKENARNLDPDNIEKVDCL